MGQLALTVNISEAASGWFSASIPRFPGFTGEGHTPQNACVDLFRKVYSDALEEAFFEEKPVVPAIGGDNVVFLFNRGTEDLLVACDQWKDRIASGEVVSLAFSAALKDGLLGTRLLTPHMGMSTF